MEKKNVILSIAIAVYNEEKKLEACLSSVASIADEIVVVDGGSTDKTLTIAQQYNARIIKTNNPAIFHINKQIALEACKGDWILQLDADEVVTSQLRDEILAIFSPQSSVISPQLNGYYVPRKNFFCGHWLRKGGQYPDYVIRLLRRGHAHFPSMSVHEQIAVEGLVGYLRSPLFHYSYDSIAEYWRKANAYIDLQVQELKTQNLAVTPTQWLIYNVAKPTQTFLGIYLRHKGFVDGVWGFLFALFSALHYPLSYWKYKRLLRRV